MKRFDINFAEYIILTLISWSIGLTVSFLVMEYLQSIQYTTFSYICAFIIVLCTKLFTIHLFEYVRL